MKRWIALALALALLTAASALAEELPYIRQLEQYEYVNRTLLTDESYPEVRLMTSYAFWYFSSTPREPLFLCFAGPEGAQPASFESYWAHFLDMDDMIAYDYELEESDSFEEFLNRAPAEDCVLLDGADGTAAYIDPDNGCAYGLIRADGFGKSAKLWLRISMHDLDVKMPLQTRVDALTGAILPEVGRVQREMRYETLEPFWSTGRFAGVKMLDYEYKVLCRLDFPALEATLKDGGVKQAPLTVANVDGTRLEGIYGFGDGVYAEFEMTLDTYAAAANKLEEKDYSARQVLLDNGSLWAFYASNVNDDGSIFAWYGARAVDGLQDRYGNPYYLGVRFASTNGIAWEDVGACRKVLSAIEANLSFVDPADDPFVAPEEAGEAAEPAEASAAPTGAPAGSGPALPEGSWACPECGQVSDGSFCPNCGAARPAPAGWTCPECGQVNDGNFCPNCGTARP